MKVTLKKIVIACPARWEGKTEDGKEVDVKYRYGVFSVYVDNQQVFSGTIGGRWDGSMSNEELQKYMEELKFECEFDGSEFDHCEQTATHVERTTKFLEKIAEERDKKKDNWKKIYEKEKA